MTKTNICSYISQDEVSNTMKHSQQSRSSEGIHSCGLSQIPHSTHFTLSSNTYWSIWH